MKRQSIFLAAVAAAIVLAGGLLMGHWAQAQMYGGDGPGFGPGMMWGEGSGDSGWGRGHGGWGGGPGMMWGGGPGSMWGGGEFGAYSQLPQEKRAQLRELSVDTQRKMVTQRAAMEELMLSYSAAVQKFPVDRDAAAKAWQGMEAIRKQMFEQRLDSMAKAQQILGKETWEKMHEGWGPNRGGPPGRH